MIRSKRRIALPMPRAFLHAFGMRDVGAQAVALLQRALQHGDRAARCRRPSSTRSTPVSGISSRPRHRAHRSVICTSGRLMRCETSSMMPANRRTDENGRGDQADRERKRPSASPTRNQFVAQRKNESSPTGQARSRAIPPKQAFAVARPVSGRPWFAARNELAAEVNGGRGLLDAGYRNRVLPREHEQARSLEPRKFLQRGFARAQCAIRDQAGNTSPKSSKMGCGTTNAIGAPSAHPAPEHLLGRGRACGVWCRTLAVVIGENREISCASTLSCNSRLATTMSTLSLAARTPAV